jgi:hypothetical protein
VRTPTETIADWLRGSPTPSSPQPDPGGPRINIWLNSDDPYARGDKARVYFHLSRDAYVTVFRIDTDGRVRVLFPLDPWTDGFARSGKNYEVLGRDMDEAFRVSDAPGVGYIFAVASDDPFTYDPIVRDDHWDYRAISDGRVRGDPYVAATDLAAEIAPEGSYDYDVAEYYVEQHYDYPRFVCYDCHTYATYYHWDPYSTYCARFRIVIYNDRFYYPYRYYGNSVVVARPFRPGPRYVFKDRDDRNDYLTRVAERPREDPGRGRDVGERTSADVGGRGTVPAPVVTRPRGAWEGGRPGGAGTDRPRAAPRSPVEPRERIAPERSNPDRDNRPAPDRLRPSDDSWRRGGGGAEGGHPGPDRRSPSRPEGESGARRGPAQPRSAPPRSTGEPQLRRRPSGH